MLNGKKLLTKILASLKSPVIMRVMTVSSRSYAANSAYWFAANSVTITQVSGYTPIAAVGGGSNSGGLIVTPILLNGDTTNLYGFARNITSSAITQALSIGILYIRNDLL